MTQKKTVFIIPGYKHKPTNKAYMKIAQMIKKEGHNVISVKIPWKESTISENTSYFIERYNRKMEKKGKRIDKKNVYLLGFSFGAMIAFLASTQLPVGGLILCSLSPYFKEDLQKSKKVGKSILEVERYRDFSKLGYKKLAKQVKAKRVLMLYGLNEEKPLIERVTKTYNQIESPRKYLLPVEYAEHNLNHKKYLRTLRYVTSTLL